MIVKEITVQDPIVPMLLDKIKAGTKIRVKMLPTQHRYWELKDVQGNMFIVSCGTEKHPDTMNINKVWVSYEE